MQVFVLFFLVASARAAPSAEAVAEAKAAYSYSNIHRGPAVAPFAHHPPVAHNPPVAHHPPVALHAGPAANCKTENDILITQNCVPRTENICNTVTVDTEEIEYVPLCKETTDVLCDAPLGYADHAIAKRNAEADADADADAYYGYGYGNPGYGYGVPGYGYGDGASGYGYGAPGYGYGLPGGFNNGYATPQAYVAPAPVVSSAVGHSVSATVKHACRSVTKEHCVDNPTVKGVPIEVEHCHIVTKVDCANVENLIPVTTCEPVTTTHVSEAVVAHHAPVVALAGHGGYVA